MHSGLLAAVHEVQTLYITRAVLIWTPRAHGPRLPIVQTLHCPQLWTPKSSVPGTSGRPHFNILL